MYCFSFSAFAACTFNCQTVNFLRSQDEILDSTTSAFQCKQKKGNMESAVSKYAVGSIVHGIQKEYGNYNMSFLMPE